VVVQGGARVRASRGWPANLATHGSREETGGSFVGKPGGQASTGRAQDTCAEALGGGGSYRLQERLAATAARRGGRGSGWWAANER
jgi:hypothetical protein